MNLKPSIFAGLSGSVSLLALAGASAHILHAFYNGYTADQRRFTVVLTKSW